MVRFKEFAWIFGISAMVGFILVCVVYFFIWAASNLVKSEAENYYTKQTAFTTRVGFEEVGKNLLEIEGDVRAQVILAIEFYTERSKTLDKKYVYGEGDYSKLVSEITDGRYTSNMHGDYKRVKVNE